MRSLCALAAVMLALGAAQAHAGQAEVRDVARLNNCPPKKIEVYQQALGAMGETIWRVECVLPKTVGTASATPTANAILIGCVQNLCEFLRPVESGGK